MSTLAIDFATTPSFVFFLHTVTDEYNESLVFTPDVRRLFYSIREPIVNRVFSNSRQRGFANK